MKDGTLYQNIGGLESFFGGKRDLDAIILDRELSEVV